MPCGDTFAGYPCCSIVHGDNRELFERLAGRDDYIIVTDPPYGIDLACDFKARGRGKLAECRDYADVAGDDVPFDPSTILTLNVPTVMWGANHFADKLPASSGWLVWDKRRPDNLDQATCELAWTNFVKGVRRLTFMWNGMLRDSKEELIHPTQKPVALSEWILSLRWTPEDGVIVDPFAGSGSTLIAAKRAGRHYLGFELSKEYCEKIQTWLDKTPFAPTMFEKQVRSTARLQEVVPPFFAP